MTPESLENNMDLTESGNGSEPSESIPTPEIDVDPQDEPQVTHGPQFEDSGSTDDEENDPGPGSPNKRPAAESTINAGVAEGNVTATQIQSLFQIFQSEKASNTNNDKSRQIFSLFDSSEITLLEDAGDLDFKLFERFKQERILLLGGSGNDNSDLVSHQIAHLLKIKKAHNIRRLDLAFYPTDPPTILTISPERKASENEAIQDAVVFVDAENESGHDFTGSLLKSNPGFMRAYSSRLISNRLYMICLVNANSVKEWIKSGKPVRPPYWPIENEKDEIPSSENEPAINREIEQLLNSGSETDGLIIRIILFIVSFFPDLTTGEFNDLVRKWLKNDFEATNEDTVGNNPENTILTKASLLEIWKKKSGFFTKQCFLQLRDKKFVSFYSKSYAEIIKNQLEDHYWAFSHEKVSDILRMRLIFHPSDSVANRSAEIVAEYLPGNEENFIDWLLWAFKTLNDEENRAENIRQILGIRDSDGDVQETGKKYFYYNRLAKLFRAVLRYPSLKTTVSNIMERLIQEHCHQSVFILIKRLQYDPNFDEPRWLEQLLQRGDAKTREEIKKYLFNGLINTDINEVTNKLSEWLPQENSPSGKYSQMNKTALELLVKYYSHQIKIFDREFFGLEPTRFPLFIFENKSVAGVQLEVLAKYLLHPLNLKLRLEGMPYIYYAALLLERWSRILCENNLAASTDTYHGEGPSNREILHILLEKVVLACSTEEQEEIKSFWRELKNFHDAVYKETSDWKIREQVVREREFLTNLIELFNTKQWALK